MAGMEEKRTSNESATKKGNKKYTAPTSEGRSNPTGCISSVPPWDRTPSPEVIGEVEASRIKLLKEPYIVSKAKKRTPKWILTYMAVYEPDNGRKMPPWARYLERDIKKSAMAGRREYPVEALPDEERNSLFSRLDQACTRKRRRAAKSEKKLQSAAKSKEKSHSAAKSEKKLQSAAKSKKKSHSKAKSKKKSHSTPRRRLTDCQKEDVLQAWKDGIFDKKKRKRRSSRRTIRRLKCKAVDMNTARDGCEGISRTVGDGNEAAQSGECNNERSEETYQACKVIFDGRGCDETQEERKETIGIRGKTCPRVRTQEDIARKCSAAVRTKDQRIETGGAQTGAVRKTRPPTTRQIEPPPSEWAFDQTHFRAGQTSGKPRTTPEKHQRPGKPYGTYEEPNERGTKPEGSGSVEVPAFTDLLDLLARKMPHAYFEYEHCFSETTADPEVLTMEELVGIPYAEVEEEGKRLRPKLLASLEERCRTNIYLLVTVSDDYGHTNMSYALREDCQAQDIVRHVLHYFRLPTQLLPLHYYYLYEVYTRDCLRRVPTCEIFSRWEMKSSSVSTTYLITRTYSHYKREEDDRLVYCRELLPCDQRLRTSRYTEVRRERLLELGAKVTTATHMIRLLEMVKAGQFKVKDKTREELMFQCMSEGFPSDPLEEVWRNRDQDDWQKESYADDRGEVMQLCTPRIPGLGLPITNTSEKIMKDFIMPHVTDVHFGEQLKHWYPDYGYLERLWDYCECWSIPETLKVLRRELQQLQAQYNLLSSTSPDTLFVEDENVLLSHLHEEELKEQEAVRKHKEFLKRLEEDQNRVSHSYLCKVQRLREQREEYEQIKSTFGIHLLTLKTHSKSLARLRAVLYWQKLQGQEASVKATEQRIRRCKKRLRKAFKLMERSSAAQKPKAQCPGKEKEELFAEMAKASQDLQYTAKDFVIITAYKEMEQSQPAAVKRGERFMGGGTAVNKFRELKTNDTALKNDKMKNSVVEDFKRALKVGSTAEITFNCTENDWSTAEKNNVTALKDDCVTLKYTGTVVKNHGMMNDFSIVIKDDDVALNDDGTAVNEGSSALKGNVTAGSAARKVNGFAVPDDETKAKKPKSKHIKADGTASKYMISAVKEHELQHVEDDGKAVKTYKHKYIKDDVIVVKRDEYNDEKDDGTAVKREKRKQVKDDRIAVKRQKHVHVKDDTTAVKRDEHKHENDARTTVKRDKRKRVKDDVTAVKRHKHMHVKDDGTAVRRDELKHVKDGGTAVKRHKHNHIKDDGTAVKRDKRKDVKNDVTAVKRHKHMHVKDDGTVVKRDKHKHEKDDGTTVKRDKRKCVKDDVTAVKRHKHMHVKDDGTAVKRYKHMHVKDDGTAVKRYKHKHVKDDGTAVKRFSHKHVKDDGTAVKRYKHMHVKDDGTAVKRFSHKHVKDDGTAVKRYKHMHVKDDGTAVKRFSHKHVKDDGTAVKRYKHMHVKDDGTAVKRFSHKHVKVDGTAVKRYKHKHVKDDETAMNRQVHIHAKEDNPGVRSAGCKHSTNNDTTLMEHKQNHANDGSPGKEDITVVGNKCVKGTVDGTAVQKNHMTMKDKSTRLVDDGTKENRTEDKFSVMLHDVRMHQKTYMKKYIRFISKLEHLLWRESICRAVKQDVNLEKLVRQRNQEVGLKKRTASMNNRKAKRIAWSDFIQRFIRLKEKHQRCKRSKKIPLLSFGKNENVILAIEKIRQILKKRIKSIIAFRSRWLLREDMNKKIICRDLVIEKLLTDILSLMKRLKDVMLSKHNMCIVTSVHGLLGNIYKTILKLVSEMKERDTFDVSVFKFFLDRIYKMFLVIQQHKTEYPADAMKDLTAEVYEYPIEYELGFFTGRSVAHNTPYSIKNLLIRIVRNTENLANIMKRIRESCNKLQINEQLNDILYILKRFVPEVPKN